MNATTGLEGITTLGHWGVVRARGADAAAFLQGQLTNDVATLEPGQGRLAGFCSAKGRLQASFVVWRAGPDELRLACARGVLPATLKRLSMFVLRAKCKLDDASAELALQGLAGASAQAAVGTLSPWQTHEVDGATLIRLPDAAGLPRALRIAPAEAALAGPAAASGSWQWLEVQSGVPLIEPATVDAFVPQMLNFELIGGVDFRKGCYPGQEIVARSQYRGTIKRRMFLFDIDAAASAGQEVFQASDPAQPAGMVVNAAARPDGSGSSALIEVKLAALADGSLHLGAADGPALALRPLPYPVPSEAAQPA